MKIGKMIFVIVVLINSVNCFAQDSIVSKTFKKDSATISTVIAYYDIDLKINQLDMELDSLFSVYKFKNPAIKTGLIVSSKKLKDYLGDLIKNGGFDKNTNLATVDFLYDFKFKNSTLSMELEKYIKSINELDLNSIVKKVAINKAQRIKNIKTVDSYTHKYNTALTILKIQLYKVIWSEIYIIDNENIGK
jgi:hypothetical protein